MLNDFKNQAEYIVDFFFKKKMICDGRVVYDCIYFHYLCSH